MPASFNPKNLSVTIWVDAGNLAKRFYKYWLNQNQKRDRIQCFSENNLNNKEVKTQNNQFVTVHSRTNDQQQRDVFCAGLGTQRSASCLSSLNLWDYLREPSKHVRGFLSWKTVHHTGAFCLPVNLCHSQLNLLSGSGDVGVGAGVLRVKGDGGEAVGGLARMSSEFIWLLTFPPVLFRQTLWLDPNNTPLSSKLELNWRGSKDSSFKFHNVT